MASPSRHRLPALLAAFEPDATASTARRLTNAPPLEPRDAQIDSTIFGAPTWAVTSVFVLMAVHLVLIFCVCWNWRGENVELSAKTETSIETSTAQEMTPVKIEKV